MGNTQTSIVLFGWGNSNVNNNRRKERNMEDDKSIRKICEDSANELSRAFEEVAKSIAETGKEFNSLMDSALDSIMKQSISEAFIEE